MASEENTQGRQVAPTQRKGKKLAPRSGMYQHFTPNDQKTLWSCKFCGDKVGADTNKHGTTNLWKHHRKCKGRGGGMESQSHPTSSSPPPQPQPQPQLQPSGPGESSDRREPAGLDDQEASRDLARMIALHGHDPSVVEDDYFRSFVRRLNPQFKLPSRDAIEDLCCDIFRSHWLDMYNSCRNAPGRISVAVGIAKTMEAGEVLYAACQFIDGEWNLHKADVDAYVVLPPGDLNLGSSFFGTPVGSLDDMVERFVTDLSEWYGDYTLFIMARGMTGDIDYGELKDSIEKVLGSDSPPTNRELICTTYMDRVLHSIARCLLPNPDFQKDIMSDVEDLGGIFQVRRECAQHGLDDPWEYDEHWYWCYFSLEILHQLGKTHTGSSELLHSLWKVIHRAIKRVSDSCHPTSNLCLEQLFTVRYALTYQLSNATTAHAGEYSGFGEKNVADVLKEALETVDKAIQDSYLVWSIPHVLDPRYKLRSIEDNFKRAFGPDDAFNYTSSIREKLKELYITNYIENDNDMEEDDDEVFDASIEEMVDDSSTTPLEQSWGDSLAEAKMELDHYLQDNPARRTKDFDILIWWKVYGSVQYPTVARMARDALAMPTCSKLTSDQMAHVRSLLCGYETTRDSFSSSAMDKASDQIAHIKSLVRGYEAKRDSFSSSAMDKAKTIEEDEEMEESSQGKAKAADRPNQERTVIGHGNTTMDDPPSQVQGNRNEWVLDTTVWVHHTFNLRLLCDLTTYNLVEVANMLPPEGQDCRLPVRGCGSVDTEDFAIPDVSYIQGESRNVISVSQLARSHDLVTVFEPTRCYVMDKLSRKIVGEGRLRNGAYVMDYLRISQVDGGGRAGGQEREGKQEEGRGGSGGGHFGGGKNDGGGVQGRGGSEAGGGADGGSGGGGGDKDKDKDKEGRKDQDIKEEDKEENEEEGKEEKEETGKEEETKGGGEDITEEEHQQLSQVPQGMFGLSQSESVVTVPTTSHVFVTPTQRNPDFIFDSGAGIHVTYFPLNQGDFKAYPSHLNITPPTQSIMGVGGCLVVYGIGYLENPKSAIDYVLYVPGSIANCVSVAQLLKDYNLRAEFDVHTFSIVQRLTGKIVGSGKMKGNLYVLDRFQAGRLVQTN